MSDIIFCHVCNQGAHWLLTVVVKTNPSISAMCRNCCCAIPRHAEDQVWTESHTPVGRGRKRHYPMVRVVDTVIPVGPQGGSPECERQKREMAALKELLS